MSGPCSPDTYLFHCNTFALRACDTSDDRNAVVGELHIIPPNVESGLFSRPDRVCNREEADMAGLVFVCDAQGKPLMPMAPAYARKLLESGKAVLQPHHAFSALALTRAVEAPTLRPVVLGLAIHLHTVELFLVADGHERAFPLLYMIGDLRTDLPWRIRRRAAHRQRRRRRSRYRTARRFGRPFALRRPSLMRSRWSANIRAQRECRRAGRHSIPPTIRWRAHAILRIIQTLRKLVPISHVILLSPHRMPSMPDRTVDFAERRKQLIAAYGSVGEQGQRVAACAYCGSTEGQIGIDHVLPRSRGGTDTWNNLVLACLPCNQRKGDRTPAEAGMPLHLPATAVQRARPYVRQTAPLLWSMLRQADLNCYWPTPGESLSNILSTELCAALSTFMTQPTLYGPATVVKPISRPRKQHFTARNYALSTPLEPSMVRIGQAIKRRVRVNRGLLLEQQGGRQVIRVVRADQDIPNTASQLVTIGMFCEARRAGQLINGIVSAVHSDGRLALLIPRSADSSGVVWERLIIRARIHLRVMSSDSVLFLHVAPKQPPAQVSPTAQ